VRNIHATLREPFDAYLAERIIADAGAETYFVAEESEIVREDSGGTSQGDAEILGEVFAFQNQVFPQPVENKIEVQFADNADVECSHEITCSLD
jgi:hypothetical protein